VAKPSPFGPVDRWRDPAREYVDTPAMKKLQEMYPDPPLVLFVSNNEAPDLRWHQVEELSRRYLDKYGKGRSDEFKRKVVAEGWIQRYPVMFQAMREALVRGGAPARRWLVYAHSPLEDRRGVEITPPEFGEVTVDVPRTGAFYGSSGKKCNVGQVSQPAVCGLLPRQIWKSAPRPLLQIYCDEPYLVDERDRKVRPVALP